MDAISPPTRMTTIIERNYWARKMNSVTKIKIPTPRGKNSLTSINGMKEIEVPHIAGGYIKVYSVLEIT